MAPNASTELHPSVFFGGASVSPLLAILAIFFYIAEQNQMTDAYTLCSMQFLSVTNECHLVEVALYPVRARSGRIGQLDFRQRL
jgi:hypothetical protein